VQKVRPSGVGKQFIQQAILASTMSPGIKIDISDL